MDKFSSRKNALEVIRGVADFRDALDYVLSDSLKDLERTLCNTPSKEADKLRENSIRLECLRGIYNQIMQELGKKT